MMTINDQISDFLRAHEEAMFSLLEKIVCIQSGSRNKKGVDRVGRLIASELKSDHLFCRFDRQVDVGDHLIVQSGCRSSSRGRILLTGHMDTVFPEDTDFNWFREDADHVYGPGVIDMKGGLVAGIYALKSLDAAGVLSTIPITFIFNSDEEIGSKTSRSLIGDAAAGSALAFVLEAGGLNGEVVTGRKGNFSIKINVNGRAGHAAFAGKNKASAILEMAHKTIALEALNDHERGITVNVGIVKGGIGPNTIPGDAGARVDFRFEKKEDFKRLKLELEKIISANTIPDTTAGFSILSQRPPMPMCKKNTDLYRVVKKNADALNIAIKEAFRQGVSDANIIADQNIPVVDGLGPIGAKDHSSHEYMNRSSLLERTLLLAHSIYACRDFKPPV